MLLCSLLSKGKIASVHGYSKQEGIKRKSGCICTFPFSISLKCRQSESQTSCPGQTSLDKAKAMEITNVGGSSVSLFLHPKPHWGVGDFSELFIPLAKPLHTVLPRLASLPSFVLTPHTSYNT